jgi:hypothetical protein
MILGAHDRLFEQENNIEFFTNNLDLHANAGTVLRRVAPIFGDAQPEGNYHEPQTMTDDALLDVGRLLSHDIDRFVCLLDSTRLE